MIDSTLFIGAIIVALTQALKYIWPGISGAITIILAMVVGGLVALYSPILGVAVITPAQGILIGLASVGAHTIASAIGTPKP